MKHAYLIMAHNEFEILERLLYLLDDKRNDIYLHIDKKSKVSAKWLKGIRMKAGRLFLIPRKRVLWGSYRQIDCELRLLKYATKEEHDYYHLISGVDLPIKSNDVIDSFFEKNAGKEFVNYDVYNENDSYRVEHKFYFQNVIGNKLGIFSKILRKMQNRIVDKQKIQNNIKVYKGENWFSITHSCAEYVLKNRKEIRKIYKYSLCGDEVFLQTLIMNSDYKKSIQAESLREIDWNRGRPYVFTQEDTELLMNSKKLWARKFSCKDTKIVDFITEQIK